MNSTGTVVLSGTAVLSVTVPYIYNGFLIKLFFTKIKPTINFDRISCLLNSLFDAFCIVYNTKLQLVEWRFLNYSYPNKYFFSNTFDSSMIIHFWLQYYKCLYKETFLFPKKSLLKHEQNRSKWNVQKWNFDFGTCS